MTGVHDILSKKRSAARKRVHGLAFDSTTAREQGTARDASVREDRVKKLAKGIASSPQFSTTAAYEDFVANKRPK
jgi:hypothetical protein